MVPDAPLLDGIRKDFPVLSRDVDGNPVSYLDSAAKSLQCQPVIDAVTHYYRDVGANIHRGKHALSEEASTVYERVRFQVAEWIGAQAGEVVFTKNTTEGLNLVAAGLPLEPGASIAVVGDSHHSALLPWSRRAEVLPVPVRADGELDGQAYDRALDQAPAAVVLTHCSNVTGVHAPVAELAARARQRGAVVVVDAAQSVPHMRIDVEQLQADFLAFSAHKMLGPTGVGVLFGRRELLERLDPLVIGGGTVDWVEWGHHDLRKLPHRFEAGTPDIAGVYGLGAAIEYLDGLDMAVVAEHDRALAAALLDHAEARGHVGVVGGSRDACRSAILSITLEGCRNLDEVARVLGDSYGIMCRSGHMCAQPLVSDLAHGQVLRISAYVYNTLEEVERAFEALDAVQRVLRRS